MSKKWSRYPIITRIMEFFDFKFEAFIPFSQFSSVFFFLRRPKWGSLGHFELFSISSSFLFVFFPGIVLRLLTQRPNLTQTKPIAHKKLFQCNVSILDFTWESTAVVSWRYNRSWVTLIWMLCSSARNGMIPNLLAMPLQFLLLRLLSRPRRLHSILRLPRQSWLRRRTRLVRHSPQVINLRYLVNTS